MAINRPLLPIPSRDEFLAGGLAGAAQVLAGHPLDTIKTRLQLAGSDFKGPVDCLVQTVRHEGVLGLFKGMAAPLAGVAVVNAVLFSAYGWCRNMQTQPNQSVHQLTLAQIALAGSGAGIVNAFVAGPSELLKIRLQMQRSTGKRAGPIALVRQIVRHHGVWNGLFRGIGATIVKEIPAYAGFYAGFEGTKRWLSDSPNVSPTDLSVSHLMLAGSVGGIGYWTCCYPLDVVKSRIQRTDPGTTSTNVITVFKEIYREAGWRGWFKGYATSLARAVPSAAATFTVYEISMRYLTHSN